MKNAGLMDAAKRPRVAAEEEAEKEEDIASTSIEGTAETAEIAAIAETATIENITEAAEAAWDEDVPQPPTKGRVVALRSNQEFSLSRATLEQRIMSIVYSLPGQRSGTLRIVSPPAIVSADVIVVVVCQSSNCIVRIKSFSGLPLPLNS